MPGSGDVREVKCTDAVANHVDNSKLGLGTNEMEDRIPEVSFLCRLHTLWNSQNSRHFPYYLYNGMADFLDCRVILY